LDDKKILENFKKNLSFLLKNGDDKEIAELEKKIKDGEFFKKIKEEFLKQPFDLKIESLSQEEQQNEISIFEELEMQQKAAQNTKKLKKKFGITKKRVKTIDVFDKKDNKKEKDNKKDNLTIDNDDKKVKNKKDNKAKKGKIKIGGSLKLP